MTWTDLKQNWADGDDFTAAAQNAVASAINAIVDGASSAYVAASETTTSSTFADLTTTTDFVTVNIGSSGKAIVLLACYVTPSGTNAFGHMGFALTGSNTVAADISLSIGYQAYAANSHGHVNGAFLLTGLTAGSTTFKAKYYADSGTSTTFQYRRIAVLPLP